MEKYVFTIDEDENIGTTVRLASIEDFDEGNLSSYDFSDDIREFMDEIGSELMEGIWEISDIDETIKKLLSKGFIENKLKN